MLPTASTGNRRAIDLRQAAAVKGRDADAAPGLNALQPTHQPATRHARSYQACTSRRAARARSGLAFYGAPGRGARVIGLLTWKTSGDAGWRGGGAASSHSGDWTIMRRRPLPPRHHCTILSRCSGRWTAGGRLMVVRWPYAYASAALDAVIRFIVRGQTWHSSRIQYRCVA